MTDEPDIVQILREEERLGTLQSSPSTATDTTMVSPPSGHQKTPQTTTSKPTSRYEPKRTIIDLVSPQEKFETIFENFSVAITLADNEERIVSWNKYTEELLNMQEADLFMKPVRTLYPHEEWEKIRKENVRQKGIRYRMETKMIRKDHGAFDVDLSICILKGFKGELVGSVAIITDITELKKVEKELKESEKKYRTIFDNSAVAITMTDEHERIISWNRYAELLLGMNKEDLLLKPVRDLYPEAEWKKIRSQHIRQKGMQHHLETKILKKNNEQLDVDISLSVLKNHEDRVVGSIGVMKDISARKRIEKILEESEKKFKLLYEKAPVPYHTLSPEGSITDVNEKWCQAFGYTKDEVCGKSIFDFISEKEKTSAQKSFAQKISEGKSYTGGREREYLTKNGEKKLFVAHDFFLFDETGKVLSVYTTMEDITENKQIEQALKVKVNELERYKTITVNREMKMMELKNEINELYIKQNQKPKY
ncbi:MAG: PAS domain-containing protein [Candidatus Thermoplasmatota archaeon]|jgi:PAS domain S-box-containing protein|nr:PAS domain-containing protein [Candidatus Thermoplasmatota archaeon]